MENDNIVYREYHNLFYSVGFSARMRRTPGSHSYVSRVPGSEFGSAKRCSFYTIINMQVY